MRSVVPVYYIMDSQTKVLYPLVLYFFCFQVEIVNFRNQNQSGKMYSQETLIVLFVKKISLEQEMGI